MVNKIKSVWNAGDLVGSLGQKDPFENRMATHPSILVWRIPWTVDSGTLQSMRSQRLGHN